MDPLLATFSADALRAELRARAPRDRKTASRAAASGAGLPYQAGSTRSTEPGAVLAAELRRYRTPDLIVALRALQKGIYGTDDRLDIYEVGDPKVSAGAASVAAVFHAADVSDDGAGNATLRTRRFGTSKGLCVGERFVDQPVGARCTAFLIEEDVVATAGHCVHEATLAARRFVFGFRMRGPGDAVAVVPTTDVYAGKRILGRRYEPGVLDWAVVQLDRKASGRMPLSRRAEGEVGRERELYMLGHPAGLPLKYAPGAVVRDNSQATLFVANLDAFGGNSGSPVFDAETHTVEGILFRGDQDYVYDDESKCNRIAVCPANGCDGELCTRITLVTYAR